MKYYKRDFCIETQEWARKYSNACVAPEVPVMDIEERVRQLEKYLPKFDQFEKYPALKEAYKEYMTIEKLILGN